MNEKGEVGEICGRPDRAVSFEWKIPDVFTMIEAVSYLYSPNVNFMGSTYYLHLYGDDELNEGGFQKYMYVVFHKESGKVERVNFVVGIKKANGTKEAACHGTLEKGETYIDHLKFMQLSYLVERRSELAPLDILTITCTLWSDGMPSMKVNPLVSSETQTGDLPKHDSVEKECCTHLEDEDGALLRKHLQNLLLEGRDRDVMLKVEDKVFKAHKDFLRVRSPVFAAMFAHEMKEAETGEVTIEDCDPDAFGQLLEYVYTGRVSNLTPGNALGLYYAADKYDFSSLKKMCVEYLKTSLSTNGVCDVIAMAVKHNEEGLRDCAMAFFTNHLHDILVTVEWQRLYRRDPSLANELNIKAMKSYKKVG